MLSNYKMLQGRSNISTRMHNSSNQIRLGEKNIKKSIDNRCIDVYSNVVDSSSQSETFM